MTDKQIQIAQLFLARFQYDTREYNRTELLRAVNQYMADNQWEDNISPIEGSEEVSANSLTTHVLKKLMEFRLIDKRDYKNLDRDDWYVLTDDGKRAGEFRGWLQVHERQQRWNNYKYWAAKCWWIPLVVSCFALGVAIYAAVQSYQSIQLQKQEIEINQQKNQPDSN